MRNALEMIREHKVVAIIRGIPSEYILQTVQALKDGGIRCMEVTFNQKDPDGSPDTLKSIRMIKEHFGDEIAVGAGTVMTVQNVLDAAAAGAEYMISPNTNPDVIRKTKELGLVSIPGAMTPTEAAFAYECGADIVKLFPAAILGTAYIKALTGPLNYIPFTAVGGVNEKNAADFIAAGCIGLGVGGNLVSKKLITEGRFDEITRLASEYKI